MSSSKTWQLASAPAHCLPHNRHGSPSPALVSPSGRTPTSIFDHALPNPNVSSNNGEGHEQVASLQASPPSHPYPYGTHLGLTAGSNNSLGRRLRQTITGVKKSGVAIKRSISATRARTEPVENGVTGVGLGGTPRHGRSMSENLGYVNRGDVILGLERSTTAASDSLSADASGE